MQFNSYLAQEIEPAILKYWKEQKILEKLREKNLKGEKFYFLEGPPYTSGRVHIGTAWQTAMKDIILRYKRMRGFNVWDRMGYDMHGLPTEQKVMKKFDLKNKEDIEKFGLAKFTKECTTWCKDMMVKMNEDFIRLGISLDFSDPYQPITQNFMEAEWWLIKKAHEKKRLYQGLRTMHWDAATQSAVAKHELEYKDVTDNSIYMKFPFADEKNKFLIIWTTTPWTIPLNLAIMVNPQMQYAEVSIGEETWVVASSLLETVMKKAKIEKYQVISKFPGKDLEGIKYIHPLNLKVHLPAELQSNQKLYTVLLSSEYVDDSAGTGLVHCAPGCGPEDYEVGHLYHIPPFNCVNEEGIFEDLGEFSGWRAKVDDSKFITALENVDSIIAKEPYVHEYPYGERSHEPVIFRTTKQWFFKVEDIKGKMLAANKDITWNPASAKNAFNSWLENLRDNSITKQRYWGTAVPIWQAEDGDYLVVGSVKELEELSGQKVTDMHIPAIDEIKIEKNGKIYTRIPDVLDVWIDAGTASWNCLDYPKVKENFEKFFPADFILEGKDQIRGWFNLLMIASFLALDRPSFKNVYMHGFLTDVDGVKMSKSLGNIITPDELIAKHGADVLRYYMFQTNAGVDINFSWDECRVKERQLHILFNIHKLLINLVGENKILPSQTNENEVMDNLGVEERYVLSRLHSTIDNTTKLLENYKLDEIIAPLEELFLDLSRTYIQMTREKSSQGSQTDKQICIYTINKVLSELLKMFSIISPFICEAINLNLLKAFDLEQTSITHSSWPKVNAKLINVNLETEMELAKQIIQAGLNAREQAKIGLRWPVIRIAIVTPNYLSEELKQIIARQLNAKEVKIQESVEGVTHKMTPNYKIIGPLFGKDSSKVIKIIENADSKQVLQVMNEKEVEINGFKISKEMVNFKQQIPEQYYSAQFKQGLLYLDKTSNDDLLSEGYAREVTRQIQSLRKEKGLQRSDEISLQIFSESELLAMLEKFSIEIRAKVGAVEMELNASSSQEIANSHAFTIKGKKFLITMKRM